MCLENNWRKITAFSLAFVLGCFAFDAFNPEVFESAKVFKTVKVNKNVFRNDTTNVEGGGMGFARCDANAKAPILKSQKNGLNNKNSVSKPMKITLKPRAILTDLARQNGTQGSVVLRVTFLANGKIGDIFLVSGLPDGLTEQAIEAAKKMTFEPQKVNGELKTVTKSLQFNFTIY